MKRTIARRKLILGMERLRALDTTIPTGVRGGVNASNAACTQTCMYCDNGTENTMARTCPP
jgi:hypothetical protein